MKKFRELKEETHTPPIGVRSLYTKMYAKHGGTASQAKDAQSKAYAEVEKKHGKDMRNSLEAFHKKNMNEEMDNKKHPFVAVHAKKGTHETHASTSYEAAQNAAKHWKMKNTAGIDVYRSDKTHVGEEYSHMNEAVKDKFDIGEYDQEGDMAKSDLRSILANAKRVHDMLEDDDNLPEWVQSKITKAEDYMSTVANYMEAEMNEATSAYGRINARFKKLSGSSLEDTAAKHRKEAERLQKEIDAQQAENERRKAAMKTEEVELDELSKDTLKSYAGKVIDKTRTMPQGEKKQKHLIGLERSMDKMKKEETELEEKNEPTNPELWSRAKVSMAKSKFDVYPSAYANGWAAKWYKSKGGGWRSVNEENYEVTVMHTTQDGDKGEHTHKITNANDARHAKNIALQKHEKMLNSKGLEVRGMGTKTAKVVEAKENDLPFTPDAPKKKSVVVGKKPEGYSIARQLARQAMQSQIEKLKKPVKEAEEKDLPFKSQTKTKQEVIPGKYGAGYSMARHLARQAMQKQIEKMQKKPMKEESNKAKIVKDIMKKKKNSSENAFQNEPELSSTLTKGF
jgi:hypothetical protein